MIFHTSLRKQQAVVDKDLYIVYNKTAKYKSNNNLTEQ